MKKSLIVGVVGAALGFVLAACGSSSSNSASYTCCVNGLAYNCPSADAASKCVNDQSVCTRDSSRDAPSGSTTCKAAN